jgi:Flp pilus assembly protein protease CpaA
VNLFNFLSFAVSFAFLLYASVQDLKTKTISNKVWLFYAPCGLFLAVMSFSVLNPYVVLFYIINLCLTVIISLALWELGVYGGADTKALICVGFAHPTSLLVFAYTGLLMIGANLAKKKQNLPLLPFMTLALSFVFIHVLMV